MPKPNGYIQPVAEIPALNPLLARSAALQDALAVFLGLTLDDPGPRSRVSRLICGISYEHAESVKILIAGGNFTSAAGLMRLQYEAVVRAIWVFYAATDAFVEKLSAPPPRLPLDSSPRHASSTTTPRFR